MNIFKKVILCLFSICSFVCALRAANPVSLSIYPTNGIIQTNRSFYLFRATVLYDDGSYTNVSATWLSLNTNIAKVPGGFGGTFPVGVSQGVAQIRGVYQNVSNTVSLIVTNNVVPWGVRIYTSDKNVTVNNDPISIVTTNAVKKCSAVLMFSDLLTESNITTSVSWTSSVSTVASVNANGLAQGLMNGDSIISATWKPGISDYIHLVVTNQVMPIYLGIAPASALMKTNTSLQFKARLELSNNMLSNVTTNSIWTWGGAPGDGSVTQAGIVNTSNNPTMGLFPSFVSVDFGGLSGLGFITITNGNVPPIVLDYSISPQNMITNPSVNVPFIAQAQLSDMTTSNVTTRSFWSSSDTNVASVNYTNGLVTTLNPGVAIIKATFSSDPKIDYFEEFIASTALIVSNTVRLTNLVVVPLNPTLQTNHWLPFKAQAFFSDGSISNIQTGASWSSSNLTIATIGINGVATGLVPGVTRITAVYSGFTNSTLLTVTNGYVTPFVIGVAIAPTNATIQTNQTLPYTLQAIFSDFSYSNINNTVVAWKSFNTNVSVIGANNGIATGKVAGVTMIQGVWNGFADSTSLTVTNGAVGPVLIGLTIQPTGVVSNLSGRTNIFVAQGTYQLGGGQFVSNVTQWAVWGSSQTNIAQVIGAGMLKGIGFNKTVISASLNGFVATAKLFLSGLGDLNYDGIVNNLDNAVVTNAFGKQTGDSGYNTNADNNGDGVVNGKDFIIITKNKGNVYGPYDP